MGKASSLALQMANELTDKGIPAQFPTSPHDGKKRADYKYEITVRFWVDEEAKAAKAKGKGKKAGIVPEPETETETETETENEDEDEDSPEDELEPEPEV